jgi:hypothetical protein
MLLYADMRASMGFKGPVPTRKHVKDVDSYTYNLAVEMKDAIPWRFPDPQSPKPLGPPRVGDDVFFYEKREDGTYSGRHAVFNVRSLPPNPFPGGKAVWTTLAPVIEVFMPDVVPFHVRTEAPKPSPTRKAYPFGLLTREDLKLLALAPKTFDLEVDFSPHPDHLYGGDVPPVRGNAVLATYPFFGPETRDEPWLASLIGEVEYVEQSPEQEKAQTARVTVRVLSYHRALRGDET